MSPTWWSWTRSRLPRLLVIILGAFALTRPITNTVADQVGWDKPAAVPIAFTVLITAGWVAVVGFSRVPEPVLTLVFAGLTYAVLATLLSAIVSVPLTGTLQGPIANPVAIIPMLLINGGWGLLAGVGVLLVQRARGVNNTNARSTAPTG
ncbi:MAG: hypothetical protein ACTH2Q_01800 [Propionibacteriaceae bacterium]